MNKDELIYCLENLGFSKLEAQIYLALLEGGNMSAYQLAKKIEISRPSIYNALEHMYEKGIVQVIPESTIMYVAQQPQVLLDKLNCEFLDNSTRLARGLTDFMATRKEEKLVSFRGYEITIAKAKEILQTAESEVYINTDFDLYLFQKEFKSLKERGIRVIVFSFGDLESKGLDIEFYSHNYPRPTGMMPSRLMIAVNHTIALFADCYKERDAWTGMVTNNELMVSIACEHIHNDIYLLNLENKLGTENFKEAFGINSEFENRGWGIKCDIPEN